MLKRLIAFGLIATAGLTLSPARADTTSGTITVPSTDTGDVLSVPTRQERCAYVLGGDASNGLVGWHVSLSAAEADGTHAFTLTGVGANVYIVFYSDLGTCDNNPSPTTTGFESGEVVAPTQSGTIPEDSTDALIVTINQPNAGFTLSIS